MHTLCAFRAGFIGDCVATTIRRDLYDFVAPIFDARLPRRVIPAALAIVIRYPAQDGASIWHIFVGADRPQHLTVFQAFADRFEYSSVKALGRPTVSTPICTQRLFAVIFQG